MKQGQTPRKRGRRRTEYRITREYHEDKAACIEALRIFLSARDRK